MKILVLGNLEQARALLEPECRKARTIFHRRKDIRVIRSFSPIDPPDWILIEEKVLPRNGVPLLQSLQAMDFYPNPGAMAGESPGATPDCTRCRLVQDPGGQLRLHCGLRQRAPGPRRDGNSPYPSGEPAICFEYQAPLRRRSN
jgi:hypothetical protein